MVIKQLLNTINRYKKQKQAPPAPPSREQLREPSPARSSRQETPASNNSRGSQGGKSHVAKLPDPPIFNGTDPALFDDWLIQLKGKLRGNADLFPSEDLKILYVSSRLQGQALSLTNPRMDEENPLAYKTVTELYAHLKELYSDPNKIPNACRALQSLTMRPGQTFQEFYATFLRLVAESHASIDRLKYDLNEKLTMKL